MKQWKLFFAVLCVLLLCACGNQKRITGRAMAFENGVLTVQTETGKSYDFLVDSQKTAIFDLVSSAAEEPLDGDCRVQVNWTKKQGQRHAEFIWIDSRLQRNVLQLSDGTPIDIWEYNGWREYCMKDGTVLLIEEYATGPENTSRWNELLYYEDFPEAAQKGIKDYYAEMGQRYEIPALLEDAYLVYGLSEEYNTKLVGQHVNLEAWNETLICCQVNLTIPRERTNGYAESFCEGAVFDWETGEQISSYDLFTISAEELEDYLLNGLDHDRTLDRENIRLNLKPEQIVLRRDGGIDFFLVDRVDHGVAGMLQIGLSPEQAQQILHPWAVINQEDKK